MARVLLIEDDPLQRALAGMVLAGGGHEVAEAGNGEEGLRMAAATPPELVVCDVVMPGMNGYQFVTTLRKQAGISGIPVILLTSLSERAQMRVGMNAGADDYLPKPFRPDELLEAVGALLERRRAQYQAIAGSVREDLDAALARQREQLAARYESQLLQELNSRWNVQVEAGRELVYQDAAVLAADLFDVIERHGAASPDPAGLLKRAHEAARDALYLFGATQVLPHRPDVLAVFDAGAEPGGHVGKAVRAAFALQAAMTRVLGKEAGRDGLPAGPTMAIAVGPFSVLRLQDPLHGDGGLAPVPGPTLQRVQALRTYARAQDWTVAASAEAVGQLAHGVAARAREGVAVLGDGTAAPVVELRRPED